MAIDQRPRAGTRLEKGQRVNLDVAQAAVKVPMLRGLTSRDANDVLKRNRLGSGKVTTSPVTASAPGTVLSQRVPPDTLVAAGTLIDFVSPSVFCTVAVRAGRSIAVTTTDS